MSNAPQATVPARLQRTAPTHLGLLYAFGAFGVWGLAPVYFRAVLHVPPLEVVAHRVVWSLLLVAVLITVRGRWREVRLALSTARNRWTLLATATLITGNWLLFIWAVHAGRLLEASLGYFINPLISVLLGVAFLGERLGRRQLAAVGLAALAVANHVFRLGVFPWVSLALAISFALYGLLRKQVQADSLVGLLLETAFIAPLAAGYLALLASQETGHFLSTGIGTDALLMAGGVITAAPLLWFVNAARLLPLSTVGLMQYLTPTGQFLLAVFAWDEPFTEAHALTFAGIWAALALYSAGTFGGRRATAAARGG